MVPHAALHKASNTFFLLAHFCPRSLSACPVTVLSSSIPILRVSILGCSFASCLRTSSVFYSLAFHTTKLFGRTEPVTRAPNMGRFRFALTRFFFPTGVKSSMKWVRIGSEHFPSLQQNPRMHLFFRHGFQP